MRFLFPYFGILVLAACGSGPQTPEEHTRKGDQLLAKGDTAGAQAAYRVALGQDSLNPDLLAKLGRIYAGQGKSQPADIYLRRASDLTFRQAQNALQAGDPAMAREALEHTLAINPYHPLALLRLGDMALEQGEEDRALGYFEQAIAANPEYAEGYAKAGKVYLRRQRYEDARSAFERCIELNINSIDAYLGLGEMHLSQQNPGAAAENYRKVLLIDPRSAVAKAALANLGEHP